jgi:hypothetical protein
VISYGPRPALQVRSAGGKAGYTTWHWVTIHQVESAC